MARHPSKPGFPTSGATPPPKKTLLQSFLDVHRIPSARIERRAKVSRRQMVRWRQEANPTIGLPQMIRVLRAVRDTTGKRVQMAELFELEPDNWTH